MDVVAAQLSQSSSYLLTISSHFSQCEMPNTKTSKQLICRDCAEPVPRHHVRLIQYPFHLILLLPQRRYHLDKPVILCHICQDDLFARWCELPVLGTYDKMQGTPAGSKVTDPPLALFQPPPPLQSVPVRTLVQHAPMVLTPNSVYQYRLQFRAMEPSVLAIHQQPRMCHRCRLSTPGTAGTERLLLDVNRLVFTCHTCIAYFHVINPP